MNLKRIFAVISLLVSIGSFAQDATTVRKKHFNLENGIAIDGYDPVAYFKTNKAVKGNKSFSVYHQGATYYFSTADNKNAFLQSPHAYEPQYGGWCAYAMGKEGDKVSIDPETFKIVNGKLYLFYNKFFNNTLKSWNKDETSLKTTADTNWKKTFH
jgi:YHS domain-containing protein